MKRKAIITILMLMLSFTALFAEETVMAGVHDFGDIGKLAEFSHTFKVKNETGKDFSIEHFDISCPCVQIITYPDMIKAGEVGEIKIRFYPYGEGRVRRTVMVVTDSPDVKNYKLIVKANFLTKLEYQLKEVDGVRIASEVIMRREKKRAADRYISVARAEEKTGGSEKPAFIDVRDQLSYNRYNIAGSINMPLYMIKTRSFLRTKDIIIVSEGYSSGTLEAEVESLKKSGFKVSILKGGINSWLRKGLPLSSKPASMVEGSLISSDDLYKDRDYKDIVIVDASKERADNSYYLPTSKHIPFKPGSYKGALTQFKGKTIVVINSDGKGYEQIEADLKGAGYDNLFYLAGGILDYKQFLKRQTQLLYPAESIKTQRKKKCGSCP